MFGVDEQHARPGLAAVGGAIDAALLLRAGQAAERAGEDDVGVGRIDDDASDAAGFIEAHVGPGVAGVGGFVDAVAHHVDVADGPGFAGSGPDDVWIRRARRRARRWPARADRRRSGSKRTARRRWISRLRRRRRRRSKWWGRRGFRRRRRCGCRPGAHEAEAEGLDGRGVGAAALGGEGEGAQEQGEGNATIPIDGR